MNNNKELFDTPEIPPKETLDDLPPVKTEEEPEAQIDYKHRASVAETKLANVRNAIELTAEQSGPSQLDSASALTALRRRIAEALGS